MGVEGVQVHCMVTVHAGIAKGGDSDRRGGRDKTMRAIQCERYKAVADLPTINSTSDPLTLSEFERK